MPGSIIQVLVFVHRSDARTAYRSNAIYDTGVVTPCLRHTGVINKIPGIVCDTSATSAAHALHRPGTVLPPLCWHGVGLSLKPSCKQNGLQGSSFENSLFFSRCCKLGCIERTKTTVYPPFFCNDALCPTYRCHRLSRKTLLSARGGIATMKVCSGELR